MPHYLVSGIAELAADVADVLRGHGATAVEVGDIDDVPAACAAAGPDAFDGYVQLPATFTIAGATAIERVHHFFAAGVLARFPALQAALGALRPGARVTFVMGVLPPDVATADDITARSALVGVLGHAARADAPSGISLSVLPSGTSASAIAANVLHGDRDHGPAIPDLDNSSYADWRVELLGLVQVQS